jgi:hypothetical protein
MIASDGRALRHRHFFYSHAIITVDKLKANSVDDIIVPSNTTSDLLPFPLPLPAHPFPEQGIVLGFGCNHGMMANVSKQSSPDEITHT